MIGVIANPGEQEAVCEFFELFKTPWEFYRPGGRYDVLLNARESGCEASAKLTLIYSGRRTSFDDEQGITVKGARNQPCVLIHQGIRLPLYGETITFDEIEGSLLTDEHSDECGAFLKLREGRALARIGYDLFSEVRQLLTVGQPPANAALPALELHIALLRDLIREAGVPLVEIPAVPDGYKFMVCLTHDVDHPSIRNHKFDHTVLGFFYRAALGSVIRLIRGQMTIREVLANWLALMKLPLIYAGLAQDFWSEFADRYLEIQGSLPSTFFVIPYKGYPGRRADGCAPSFRAAAYAAQDIAGVIGKLISRGQEVGLHGIDAWLESSKGSEELAEIRRLTKASEIGVRMHWLYFDQQTPSVLEKAGAAYDSSLGYNETVGYRAGTTQAFRPLGLKRLIELPMHMMDTAMFYPDYLNLSPQQAKERVVEIADNAVRHGGVVTINWHDRSLAPERQWDKCFRELIAEMENRNAWFCTAGEAVAWFRKRRSAEFQASSEAPVGVRVTVADDCSNNIPALTLRTHKAYKPGPLGAWSVDQHHDVAINNRVFSMVPTVETKSGKV